MSRHGGNLDLQNGWQTGRTSASRSSKMKSSEKRRHRSSSRNEYENHQSNFPPIREEPRQKQGRRSQSSMMGFMPQMGTTVHYSPAVSVKPVIAWHGNASSSATTKSHKERP